MQNRTLILCPGPSNRQLWGPFPHLSDAILPRAPNFGLLSDRKIPSCVFSPKIGPFSVTEMPVPCVNQDSNCPISPALWHADSVSITHRSLTRAQLVVNPTSSSGAVEGLSDSRTQQSHVYCSCRRVTIHWNDHVVTLPAGSRCSCRLPSWCW